MLLLKINNENINIIGTKKLNSFWFNLSEKHHNSPTASVSFPNALRSFGSRRWEWVQNYSILNRCWPVAFPSPKLVGSQSLGWRSWGPILFLSSLVTLQLAKHHSRTSALKSLLAFFRFLMWIIFRVFLEFATLLLFYVLGVLDPKHMKS